MTKSRGPNSPWQPFSYNHLETQLSTLIDSEKNAVSDAIQAILSNPYNPPGYAVTTARTGSRKHRTRYHLWASDETVIVYEPLEAMPPAIFRVVIFWMISTVYSGGEDNTNSR